MVALVILILAVVALWKYQDDSILIQVLAFCFIFVTLQTTLFFPVGDGSWEVEKSVELREVKNVDNTDGKPVFVIKESESSWKYYIESKVDSDKYVLNDEEKSLSFENVEIIETNEVEPSFVTFREANNPFIAFAFFRAIKYAFYIPEGSVVLDLSIDG